MAFGATGGGCLWAAGELQLPPGVEPGSKDEIRKVSTSTGGVEQKCFWR